VVPVALALGARPADRGLPDPGCRLHRRAREV